VGRTSRGTWTIRTAARERRAILWLTSRSDSRDAFLKAEKRSRREVAVILNRVPDGLDAAHIGFGFIDVMGNDHYDAQWRRSISQAGFTEVEFVA